MSSVQEKEVSLNQKVLRRKSSFQKIKCSARSVLIGSIFSKNSTFIHLLENALNSSRAFVQKPAIVLVMPTVHILCVAMAVCVNLIRKLTGGVSCEKLDKFIIEINQLKLKHQSYSTQKAIRLRIASNIETQNVDNQIDEARVESYKEESFVDRFAIRDESRLQQRANLLLHATSILAVAFAYSQFLILLYLAGCSSFRAGYIFLLVCILSISWFIFKISFIKQRSLPLRLYRRQQASNKGLYAPKPSKAVFSEIQTQSHKIEDCLGKVKLL